MSQFSQYLLNTGIWIGGCVSSQKTHGHIHTAYYIPLKFTQNIYDQRLDFIFLFLYFFFFGYLCQCSRHIPGPKPESLLAVLLGICGVGNQMLVDCLQVPYMLYYLSGIIMCFSKTSGCKLFFPLLPETVVFIGMFYWKSVASHNVSCTTVLVKLHLEMTSTIVVNLEVSVLL